MKQTCSTAQKQLKPRKTIYFEEYEQYLIVSYNKKANNSDKDEEKGAT